jgi:hypothetical protein
VGAGGLGGGELQWTVESPELCIGIQGQGIPSNGYSDFVPVYGHNGTTATSRRHLLHFYTCLLAAAATLNFALIFGRISTESIPSAICNLQTEPFSSSPARNRTTLSRPFYPSCNIPIPTACLVSEALTFIMAEQWPGVQVLTPFHFTLSNKKLGNMYSVSSGRLAIGTRPTSLHRQKSSKCTGGFYLRPKARPN